MAVSRRNFLKISGGTLLVGPVLRPTPAVAHVPEMKTSGAVRTTSICPYCSVGCGMVVHAKNGKVVNVDGDAEHPINEGALCSKGASVRSLADNPLRVTTPMYRAPGAAGWTTLSWDEALDKIARNVKDSRDKSFKLTTTAKVKEKLPDGSEQTVEKEYTVNRTDAIAHVGSAALDNEECYLLQKLVRSWGLVYIEHQARI